MLKNIVIQALYKNYFNFLTSRCASALNFSYHSQRD